MFLEEPRNFYKVHKEGTQQQGGGDDYNWGLLLETQHTWHSESWRDFENHEGYFDLAFLPFLETKRVLNYTHNGKDQLEINLQWMF